MPQSRVLSYNVYLKRSNRFRLKANYNILHTYIKIIRVISMKYEYNNCYVAICACDTASNVCNLSTSYMQYYRVYDK